MLERRLVALTLAVADATPLLIALAAGLAVAAAVLALLGSAGAPVEIGPTRWLQGAYG